MDSGDVQLVRELLYPPRAEQQEGDVQVRAECVVLGCIISTMEL